MKKNTGVFILVLLLGWVSLSSLPPGGQDDPEKIREEVRVVNVEVPVRVISGRKPVAGLARSDFRLYENGKPVEIQGFFQVSKKINREQIDLTAARDRKPKPRYFVLVFRVSNLNKNLEDSVKYFINSLLKPTDKLLMFVNDRTLFFDPVPEPSELWSIARETLSRQCQRARFRVDQYYLKITQAINQTRMRSLLSSPSSDAILIADDVILFLESYLAIWREYKDRFLLPDVDSFYNFARFLEKINLEKWVISFYQFERFPELKFSGELRTSIRTLISDLQQGRSEDSAKSRILSRLLAQVDRELKVSIDFPSEEISKLFYKANATFHSLFFTSYGDVLSKDLEINEINSEVENCLRLITEKTGGELLVSNRLDVSLKKAVEIEDVYYVLTYAPENPDQVGKINVKVSDRRYDVLFDDNIRADYIADYLKRRQSEVTDVRLEDVTYKNQVLEFAIRDIMLREVDGKKAGLVKVHVVIKDPENNPVFDQSRTLKPDHTEVHVKIGVDWLEPETYNLIIDVEDLISQKSDFKYLNI